MTLPEAAKLTGLEEAKYIEMEKRDPATAREWRAYDKRIAARKGGRAALREMDSDDGNSGIVDVNGDPITRWDFADDA
jgi:hypothetical protein